MLRLGSYLVAGKLAAEECLMPKRQWHTIDFIEQVCAAQTDECVLWPYGLNRQGYAMSRAKKVHRIVCEIAYGAPPPDKRLACHSCGVKRCVNPRHIYWGSAQQNRDDGRRMGEWPVGSDHGSAKLTEQQVREIRMSAGTCREIGKRYGVSHTTIERVRNRENWAHVD
jgi:hypothetical protein